LKTSFRQLTTTTKYGTEFGSDAMVAQGLAQTLCHSIFGGVDLCFDDLPGVIGTKDTYGGITALEALREVYDSDVLKPVLPYDPDAFISKRSRDAYTPERVAEIKRIVAKWTGTVEQKLEDLVWLATLLLVGCGKPGRKPRLDFFLMHQFNSTIFLPSLLAFLDEEDQHSLLNAHLATTFLVSLIRGRPRIDVDLAMSYTNMPKPSTFSLQASPEAVAPGEYNPWQFIIADVIHAPETHVTKCIRTLYHWARQYGTMPPGSVRGAFLSNSFVAVSESSAKEGVKGASVLVYPESHAGIAKLDGSLFVRAAGPVMSRLGWVTHGQKAGEWDRSGLGWNAAWDNED
jgi:pre-mRNA-splicing factor ATP-dependent RNA helicase DHX16